MGRKRPISEEIKEAEESAGKRIKKNEKLLKKGNLLSSGSTLLDLSCSDRSHGAFVGGRYYLFIGASSAGKTWVCYQVLAESCMHPKFKDHKCIFDDVEVGSNMDIEYFFGKKLANKLQPPAPGRKDKEGLPHENSKTIEEFYDSLDNHLDEAEANGTGIIYVLDSMDALTSEAEIKKAKDNKKKRDAKQSIETGSYGDGKAKINNQNIRRICSRLEKTNSLLLIICQERVDITSPFKAKTFSGGKGLLFYATMQIWFQIKGAIKATIKGKERDLGTKTLIKVGKNRLTGKKHKEILFPIYHSFGVDNIGASIEWLLDEKRWTKNKLKIKAPDFDVEMTMEKLVKHIEENNLEEELNKIVQGEWDEIQTLIEEKVTRKKRYT